MQAVGGLRVVAHPGEALFRTTPQARLRNGMVALSTSKSEGSRSAWTAFWNDADQSRCVSASADVWRILIDHWTSFAMSLPREARVLDLGCGAGAVARILAETRNDLHITGIDFAALPSIFRPRIRLLSHVAMESMPFPDRSFDVAVSQFGFEYGHRSKATLELTRVLAANGRFSFLAHHADSAIVSINRERLSALEATLGQDMRAAFRAGNASAVSAHVNRLSRRFFGDPLIAELADRLPVLAVAGRAARRAIWASIENALAPERSTLEALLSCCVSPEDLEDWLAPLRLDCDVKPPSVLREPNGEIVAWRIEGVRR